MNKSHQKKALSQYLHASHSSTRTYVSIISPALTDTLINVNPDKDSRKGKGVGWITILKYFNEGERERERVDRNNTEWRKRLKREAAV
jgi:hypothetical protein